MSKRLLAIISVPLVVIHLIILYFWIFNYEKLETEIGLITWVGSILLGVLIYRSYRKLISTEKSIVLCKSIVFGTTLMTLLLGVFALIIVFTVSSMP
ncbi:hypothetical protein ACMHYP_26025 [Bacillus cereus]|jgi:hypothetical protein|uniref:hypothetical protein n=1 Tax=Bacillus cereus TaxID=1396 RepID=UPI0039C01B18